MENLYAWGKGEGGALGLSAKATGDENTPKLVQHLFGKQIVDVTGGNNHSLAITDKGDVYAWGSSPSGQLGLGNFKPSFLPHHIPFFHNIKVKSISAGFDHSLVLSRNFFFFLILYFRKFIE